MLFPSPFFHVLVFSGYLFCSCVIGFLYDLSICTDSLDPLFLTLSEFQGQDWLWYPLTCGPTDGVGVHMEQKSQSKFLPRSGFEPWTSHLAVLQATARPLTVHPIKATGHGKKRGSLKYLRSAMKEFSPGS